MQAHAMLHCMFDMPKLCVSVDLSVSVSVQSLHHHQQRSDSLQVLIWFIQMLHVTITAQ
jgi:hypothetical protein